MSHFSQLHENKHAILLRCCRQQPNDHGAGGSNQGLAVDGRAWMEGMWLSDEVTEASIQPST